MRHQLKSQGQILLLGLQSAHLEHLCGREGILQFFCGCTGAESCWTLLRRGVQEPECVLGTLLVEQEPLMHYQQESSMWGIALCLGHFKVPQLLLWFRYSLSTTTFWVRVLSL